MTIAAIFTESNFILDTPYTTNLGGQYIYTIKQSGTRFFITREKNEHFVPNFFDEAGRLGNISAIVGENGVGKTTSLIEVILMIKQKRRGLVIIEDKDQTFYYSSSTHYKISSPGIKILKYQDEIETVYYSPFLDFKNELEGVDLSYDNILQEDLHDINNRYEANSSINPSDRLKRANDERILSFLKSDLKDSVQKFLELPTDDYYRVTFTRYEIDADGYEVKFDNTPLDFRPFLNELYKKIRREASEINKSNRSNEDVIFKMQKDLFKNYILMDVFCLLVKLMEQKNTYLSEGHFVKNSFGPPTKNIQESPAINSLEFWLNNYFYRGSHTKTPLPDKEVLELLHYLYNYIDGIEYNNKSHNPLISWDLQSLFFEEKDLNKVISLNRNLLTALPKYYLMMSKDAGYDFEPLRNIQNFINLEFSKRKLSTGETALLNLFSRINEYFDRNIVKGNTKKKYTNYLFLLDEADMGFHPKWKRHYINQLRKFFIFFAEKINCEVQIILTTHDPISLSDLPKNNITFLTKDVNNSKSILESSLVKTTFAANITDLFANAFFMDELIGEFAKEKINWVLALLDNKKVINSADKDSITAIIEMIDEPLLKYKIREMYYEKFPDDLDKENARQQIREIASRSGLDINF